MKILYFISVHSYGRGGHFHSLNHISQKLGEKHEVKIISIGPGKSDIIESNPHFHKHIKFKGFDFFKLKKIIRKESRLFKPDIYHCFDVGSYNIIRLIISSRKNKLILNKCGGPNPTQFPYVSNLILFSVENKEWFEGKRKFRNTNIYLIPNRVNQLALDSEFQPIEKHQDDFIFVRICRIHRLYKKSIQDSMNLISQLLSAKLKNIKLYVIGVVLDTDLLDDLKNSELVKNGHVIFLTDPEYTKEASKMLYLADAVIGTGRGLMEAASLRKPVLAIDKNRETPVMLNETYFDDAFKTNFSERNTFIQLNPDENLKNIIRLIRDKSYYSEISEFAFNCFEQFFNLSKVAQAYPLAYKQSSYGNRKLLMDSFLILQSLLYFYRSYQNSLTILK